MKYLSLFSGIGGFELGIENSNKNMTCIGFSEVDKYAKSIYKRHFPSHTDWGDVTQIRTKDLPSFEFLVGGFPCQAFSIAGKRRGFDDTRGTLFFEIARILKDKRPRYFLLENVKGLLSHDKGKTFKTILKVLSEMGYDVEWEVLNSKNFGVPQNRERIFIKGYLRTKCGGEVLSQRRASTETNGELDSYRDDKRTYSIYDNPNETISRTITDNGQNCGNRHLVRLNDKPTAQHIYDSNGLATTISANGGGQGGKTGLYKVDIELIKYGNQGSRIYSSNRISTCLNNGGTTENYLVENPAKVKITNHTKKGYLEADVGEDGVLVGRSAGNKCRGRVQKKSTGTIDTNGGWGVCETPYRVRRLTPRECERLQGFPDDWTLYGKDDEIISNTQRYKCCGNAVTTNVIKFIMDNWRFV